MSGINLSTCGKKTTPGTVLRWSLTLLATGFLVAAGYDIYSRIFKKSA
jgi:hypothetical protein